jgi:hypothetical protein
VHLNHYFNTATKYRRAHATTRRLGLSQRAAPHPPSWTSSIDRREDVAVHQKYIADIEASGPEALTTVNPVPDDMRYGENFRAGVKAHLDTVNDRAAAPIIARYTGVLAAADMEVFTRTTTFAILRSLCLDSGRSGPVHP